MSSPCGSTSATCIGKNRGARASTRSSLWEGDWRWAHSAGPSFMEWLGISGRECVASCHKAGRGGALVSVVDLGARRMTVTGTEDEAFESLFTAESARVV